jgi:uncharacterized protein DUF4926
MNAVIAEHDSVVLTRDLPASGLVAGDVGVVVHVYRDRAAYEVEFVSLDGSTIAVETLEGAQCGRRREATCRMSGSLRLERENPNQVSFIIEELTDLVEEAVLKEFEAISERGGVLGGME